MNQKFCEKSCRGRGNIMINNDYINAYVGIFLKAQLESEEQEHKKKLDTLKCKHEEEIFTLKKDVYILNAKV
jgi:hypothetical protein